MMREKHLLIAAALMVSLLVVGCIYANMTGPLSYRSATLTDTKGLQVVGESEGEACAYDILGLVGWGDGGYNAAVQAALKRTGGKMLSDVRADQRFFNVLYVYQSSCTRVNGTVVK